MKIYALFTLHEVRLFSSSLFLPLTRTHHSADWLGHPRRYRRCACGDGRSGLGRRRWRRRQRRGLHGEAPDDAELPAEPVPGPAVLAAAAADRAAVLPAAARRDAGGLCTVTVESGRRRGVRGGRMQKKERERRRREIRSDTTGPRLRTLFWTWGACAAARDETLVSRPSAYAHAYARTRIPHIAYRYAIAPHAFPPHPPHPPASLRIPPPQPCPRAPATIARARIIIYLRLLPSAGCGPWVVGCKTACVPSVSESFVAPTYEHSRCLHVPLPSSPPTLLLCYGASRGGVLFT